MSKQPGRQAMIYDALTGRAMIQRRYGKPQRWRVVISVTGEHADGQHSTSETELLPDKPVRAAALPDVCHKHLVELMNEYASGIRKATLTLFRLTTEEWRALREQKDDSEVIET